MAGMPSAKTKVMNTLNSIIHSNYQGNYRSSALSRLEWLSRQKESICYGDKIFVRVTSGRTILLEETFTSVADMTELTGEIRTRLRDTEGLSKVWIRNCTRGWATERPLMFYRRTRNAPTTPFNLQKEKVFHKILTPWETH